MKTPKSLFFILTLLIISTTLLPIGFAQDSTTWNLPEGAKARLGKGSINEIAYSPDGALLAVASSIGVWLYDTNTYQEIALLTRSFRYLYHNVAFSPDGNTIASGSDDATIYLWDVNTGTLKNTLTGHTAWVKHISFSPNGRMIASGGGDNTIRLWEVNTGTLKNTLTGHTHPVESVAFSPDGNTIASGSRDTTIGLWDADTGALKNTLTGHTDSVGSVAFSPDGNTLASRSSGEGTVLLWDVHTSNIKNTLHTDEVLSVAFSPDGNTIATGSFDETIRFWDVATGTLKNTITEHTNSVVSSVAFSPDGNTITCVSWSDAATNAPWGGAAIRFWDVDTSTLKNTLIGHTDGVNSVAFSPDGNTIATGSEDTTIRLWDVNTGTLKNTLTGHTHPVDNVAFSPDGNTIASAYSKDSTIRLWDVNTGTLKNTLIGHTSDVTGVAFSPDGNTLASGHGLGIIADEIVYGGINLWDVHTGNLKNTITAGIERLDASGVAFSPDGNIIAIGIYDTVHLWDVATGTLKSTLTGHTGSVRSVAFSPDGNTIASSSVDTTIRLWDVDTGTLKNTTITEHTDEVRSVAFSPDGNTLASGDWNGTIRLWDVEMGTLKSTLTGHTSSVRSVVFSLDGNTIASGSWDGTVLLWNIAPAEPSRLATDVNVDGTVNIQDLVQVAANFGETGENPADVNGDGQVNIQDLVAVAAAFGEAAAAPAVYAAAIEHLTDTEIKQWLHAAQQANLTDPTFQRGVEVLKHLLSLLTPKETVLLANYPNPFNPETWIPYQLSAPSEVTIEIHAIDGTLVRKLSLGHQAIGSYQTRTRAAHWDGRNNFGEPVASGIYFYTLTADDFTATRKMLIRK